MKTAFFIGALAWLSAGMAEAGEPVRLDGAQLDRVTAGLSVTFGIDDLYGGRNVVLWNSSHYDIAITGKQPLCNGNVFGAIFNGGTYADFFGAIHVGGAYEGFGIGRTLDSVVLGPTRIDFDETGRGYSVIRSSP